MVIAFDIDGTITRHPPFFAFLTQALVAAGHRVLIITFREDRAGTEADLAEWGIAYDELVTSSLETCLEHTVDGWKAAMCRKAGVEVFFEDDPGVLRMIDSNVLCLRPTDPEEEQGEAEDGELYWLAPRDEPTR